MFKLILKGKKRKHTISLHELKQCVYYNPKSGKFIWNYSAKNVTAGNIAGGLTAEGYIVLTIKGKRYKGHRLAWFYMTGKWPKHEIDHKDLNRSNNKWKNLREATHMQNMQNSLRKSNTSGYKGVHYNKRDKRFVASIGVNGKRKHLGHFLSAKEAYKDYCKAAKIYHKEFCRI